MKITIEFDNKPGLPKFRESYFESIAIACNGQDPEDIANKLYNVLAKLSSVSVTEIVCQMVDLLNSDKQKQLATDILGQWGSDIIDSVGKTAESEVTNKDHGRP